MPMMELWGGSLASALDWLRRSLEQIVSLLRPETALYDLENSAPLWLCVNPDGPSQRFHMSELASELSSQLDAVECVYRFRDRVILKGRVAHG